MNLNTVQNGTAWRSHFWDRVHRLVKEQKKSTFTVPFLGPSGGPKNETANAKSTAKADPCNEQKMTTEFSKQQAYRVGTVPLNPLGEDSVC